MGRPRKWNKQACRQQALRFHRRSDWSRGHRASYSAAQKHGWLNECCQHMVSGYRSSDNDAVYLYAFHYCGEVIHKVGLTSIKRNTGRIEETMRRAGCQAHDVLFWEVDDARDVERKMLAVGSLQSLYSGPGSTEMRILSLPERLRILRIAGDACISDPVYIERAP